MKGIKENIVLANDNEVWHKILLPIGWYQYIIFEHENLLAAHARYYIHGLINKEALSGALPSSGGMILWEKIITHISTSGGFIIKTRYVYKLFNLRLTSPVYYTIFLHQVTNATETCVVRFKYTDKKLLEVI